MKKINLTDFETTVVNRLKADPKELAEYKEFVLQEFEKDQNYELLLEGLRTVAAASCGMSKTAKTANLKRRSLYKILDKDGNPTLENFLKILKSLNLKLKIAA